MICSFAVLQFSNTESYKMIKLGRRRLAATVVLPLIPRLSANPPGLDHI